MAQDIEVNDVGRIGVITDMPAYMLPPEAITTGLNVRVAENGLETALGWEQIFGTPGVAPHFAMAVRTQAQTFWIYVSLTKAFGYDGTTHTDITRASGGDYTASFTREWNGTLLANIPILNNGIDVPQFWATPTLVTDLANLTNWPSTLRAKVVRAFGPFLTAINVSKSGTSFPHMFKWSHPAVPGTVPSSWDETDAALDAGEFELPDVDAGILLDALPLSETMYLYKESSVWKVRYVGGREIFSLGQSAWLATTGLLAPRCVCITGDGKRHVFASQDDILWHDGNQVHSLLTERRRKEIFNSIDTTNYANCFMFCNSPRQEVWFCYPSSGMTNPNRAVVFYYGKGGDVWPTTDFDGITFRNAAIGNIEGATDETWTTTSGTWETDLEPWSSSSRRRVVVCGTDDTKFFNLDKTTTRNGTVFTKTIQRLGLAIIGKKRDGAVIVDFQKMKLIDRFWMRLSGDEVSIRVGSQEVADGPVSWHNAITFDPSAGPFADVGPLSGRAIAYEVSSDGSFRFDGFKQSVQLIGDH